MENQISETEENTIPSPLMDGLLRLRDTIRELRSRLYVVLEQSSPAINEVKSPSIEREKAVDIIASTQDVVGDLLSRLIV